MVLANWILLRFDGAFRANDGYGGCGVVLYSLDHVHEYSDGSDSFAKVLEVGCSLMSTPRTYANSQAQYIALITGLRHARAIGCTKITVQGDSQLILHQLERGYDIKDVMLQQLYEEVQEVIQASTFRNNVSFECIERTVNTEAQSLTQEAIKLQKDFIRSFDVSKAKSFDEWKAAQYPQPYMDHLNLPTRNFQAINFPDCSQDYQVDSGYCHQEFSHRVEQTVDQIRSPIRARPLPIGTYIQIPDPYRRNYPLDARIIGLKAYSDGNHSYVVEYAANLATELIPVDYAHEEFLVWSNGEFIRIADFFYHSHEYSYT